MHKDVSFLTGLAIAGCLLFNAGTARAFARGVRAVKAVRVLLGQAARRSAEVPCCV